MVKNKSYGINKILKLEEQQKNRCFYCGCEFQEEKYKPRTRNVDHIIPKIKGGKSDIKNLVLACSSCNIVKGKKDLEEFREYFYLRKIGIPKIKKENHIWLKNNIKEYRDIVNKYKSFKFYGETLKEEK